MSDGFLEVTMIYTRPGQDPREEPAGRGRRLINLAEVAQIAPHPAGGSSLYTRSKDIFHIEENFEMLSVMLAPNQLRPVGDDRRG